MRWTAVCSMFGAIGSALAYLFGGWDSSIQTLLIFMVTDYITGLLVAGVFHKSQKTKTGALESKAGFKGLIKKCMILVFVMMGYRIDLELGADYFRNCIVIAFMINEAVSITENAGLMGIPIPKVITNAIDILKRKGEKLNEQTSRS